TPDAAVTDRGMLVRAAAWGALCGVGGAHHATFVFVAAPLSIGLDGARARGQVAMEAHGSGSCGEPRPARELQRHCLARVPSRRRSVAGAGAHLEGSAAAHHGGPVPDAARALWAVRGPARLPRALRLSLPRARSR